MLNYTEVEKWGDFIKEKKYRIAIIDDCEDLTEQIAFSLSRIGVFEIGGIAHTGITGLDLLMDSEFDVAIIDIVMPWKDGLYILEGLNCSDVKKPVCVMLTAMNKEPLTNRAIELGAEYFMLKPFDAELLARRIIGILEYKSHQNLNSEPVTFVQKYDPEGFTATLLRNCGIQTKFKGYHYLKTAIELSIEDPQMLQSFTKLLYPAIAKSYCVTSISIEKSIRNAINSAFENDTNIFCNTLHLPLDSKVRITSSAFISMAVEKYRLNI